MAQTNIDVAGTGYTVLDRVYEDKQKSFESLGGSCGNVLLSLAMLDCSVAPVLTFGQDSVGKYLSNEFAQAGADTRFISYRTDRESPILAQNIDTLSGQHSFSFICPETDKDFPRYQSIDASDIKNADDVLVGCSVFFTDRLSEEIIDAMETASLAGALIYFEPSSIENEFLFERALALTSILKYSSDRLSNLPTISDLATKTISIVTHSADGLEVFWNKQSKWLKSIPVSEVRDTCGAGDMLSVGIIDWLIKNAIDDLSDEVITGGIIAGQRLAAANCAFLGARGLFNSHGAGFVRKILDDELGDELSQFELFEQIFN